MREKGASHPHRLLGSFHTAHYSEKPVRAGMPELSAKCGFPTGLLLKTVILGSKK